MVKKQRIKDFWENGGELKLFGGEVRMMFDKDSQTVTVLGDRFYSKSKANKIVNELQKVFNQFPNNDILVFVYYVLLSKYRCIIYLRIHRDYIPLSKNGYTMYLSIHRNVWWYDKDIYMLGGKIEVSLSDFDKIKSNKDDFMKYSDKLELRRKKMLYKSKYTLEDILKFGGLKLSNNEYYYANIQRAGNNWDVDVDYVMGKYVLFLPTGYKYSIVVKEMKYDLSGSVIFKVVIVGNEYDKVLQVFLIGKEYTGQWWLHSLPTGYWNKSIEQCERWLLGMRRGDVLVSES